MEIIAMIIIPYEVIKEKYKFRYVNIYKFKWNCPNCKFPKGMEIIPKIEKYGGPDEIQEENCKRCDDLFKFRIIEDNEYGYVLTTIDKNGHEIIKNSK